jgi:hypothetical protein
VKSHKKTKTYHSRRERSFCLWNWKIQMGLISYLKIVDIMKNRCLFRTAGLTICIQRWVSLIIVLPVPYCEIMPAT